MKKVLSGVMSATAVVSSIAPAMAEDVKVEVQARDEVTYDEMANVKGEFSFQQDAWTPSDDLFSLFGTAATAACAKPGFAFDKVNHAEYFVNVGGKVKKTYTASLEEIEHMEYERRMMKCTCGMSPTLAMTNVTGVKVADMLKMADVEEDANTITFKDKEGYGHQMPLSYVLEKDALLVYQVADKDLEEGLQVWIPDTVAKYFTRSITDIELSKEDEVPAVEGAAPEYRAKVNVLNHFNSTMPVGTQISFQGYADDCGTAVTAVEFSLDNGKTWTAYDTSKSDPKNWIYWTYDFVTEKAGTYKLDVRARTQDGTVSPLASSVVFEVTE